MSGGTTHDQRTDEQLLRAHIHGDPTAFTILITRHQSYLWTVANRTTGNPDDAADALQEALLSAHRTAHTFRADAKVTSWLHRIVVNAALDRLRRNASRRTLPLPEFDTLALSDDADEFGRVDLAVSIDQALDELPPDQRAAVVAIDLEATRSPRRPNVSEFRTAPSSHGAPGDGSNSPTCSAISRPVTRESDLARILDQTEPITPSRASKRSDAHVTTGDTDMMTASPDALTGRAARGGEW